jgi:hypothetical protein
MRLGLLLLSVDSEVGRDDPQFYALLLASISQGRFSMDSRAILQDLGSQYSRARCAVVKALVYLTRFCD